MLQPDDVRAAGSAALGRLFALLVDQTRQAGMILTMLDAHRYRSGAIADGSGMACVTVEAVRSILTARSYRSGRPAVAELLKTEPEWLEVVAQLLTSVLHSPIAHLDGITALWDLLHAFPHTSPEPIADAHALGRALATDLTTTQRRRLRIELTGVDRRLRRGRPGRTSPADPLVACLAAVAVPG
jgi:hypothetical protein